MPLFVGTDVESYDVMRFINAKLIQGKFMKAQKPEEGVPGVDISCV